MLNWRFALLLLPFFAFAQEFNRIEDPEQVPVVSIKKTNQEIVLDGVLDEAAWGSCQVMQNFAQFFPSDTLLVEQDTEMRMCYDDDFVYFSFVCRSKDGTYITPSLRRDYGFWGSDNVTLLLDTYADASNAFVFGINAFGVRREATVCCGGRSGENFDNSWDNKWEGESKIHGDHYISEIKIPLKTIRFENGVQKWRMNTYRFNTDDNEISSWIRISRNNDLVNLSYMGELHFETPLEKSGSNISVIPYAAAGWFNDEEDAGADDEFKYNVGGDVKLALSSSLNLDGTVNPDFSQVEVDRQVTNLDRFEIFFPERRQFFLENADLFSSFHSPFANPFFSRRIGIAYDTLAETNVQNPIIYGARVTGKLNQKTRIGLMNMQTAAQEDIDLPAYNYTIAASEYLLSDESTLAVIGTNKQALRYSDFGDSNSEFNRLLGLEYRLRTADNLWTGKVSVMQSFNTAETESLSLSHLFRVRYNKRKFFLRYSHLLIGDNFLPELGFSPRRDVFIINPSWGLNWFPNSNVISRAGLVHNSEWFIKLGEDDNAVFQEKGLEQFNSWIEGSLVFTRGARVQLRAEHSRFTLLDDFDPTRAQEDDVFLSAGEDFAFTMWELSFRSDRTRTLFGSVTPTIGTFFNGKRFGVRGDINYRIQPYGSIALNVNYNRIDLPDPFVPTDLWLIGPRIDVTFSRKLFWTTFLQLNNQDENLNINTRLQWRFKPVSDFFLVYTHNYFTEFGGSSAMDGFYTKNRSLVAKLTYWLNV